jgi:hypothetical protein
MPGKVFALKIMTQVLFVTLIAIGLVGSPVVLIWGWARWTLLPKPRTVTSTLSFIGLCLATGSAFLGVFVIAHAVVTGGFPYYDSRAMRIYAVGILLALAGVSFGIGGVWRSHSLRWQAPAAGVCMLAFWMIAADAE